MATRRVKFRLYPKPGFDFLGFNIRQFPKGKHQSGKNTQGEKLGFKTIITPSPNKIYDNWQLLHRHCHDIKTTTDGSLGTKSGCNSAKPKPTRRLERVEDKWVMRYA